MAKLRYDEIVTLPQFLPNLLLIINYCNVFQQRGGIWVLESAPLADGDEVKLKSNVSQINTMKTFDVIIVGAGPAGLKCAETLGGSGYKVLVLERNAEVGQKVCAGGIARKRVECLNLPRKLIEFRYDTVNLYINNTRFRIKSKNDFVYTIDRKALGRMQLKKLEKFDNIEVQTGAEVTKIGKNYVIVDNKKIYYKNLVGADGSTSIVRRYLGIKNNTFYITAQYLVPTKEYKECEVFFNPKLFSAWYAWIFPHKSYAAIGCGCDPKVLPTKDLIKNFRKWLIEKGIDVSDAKYESFIINVDYRGYKFRNVYLIGDAGGFASELTGEGIYQALVSGEEIGQMLLDKCYKSEKIEHLLEIKRKHRNVMNLLLRSGRVRPALLYFGALVFKTPFLNVRASNFVA